MFRSKTTGRLVSFMTDAEGNSWRGDGTGRITLRPKGTDIVVRGSIAQRDRNGPGKKLKPRTDRTAHIAGMESASRMGGTKPANPAQLLRVGKAIEPKLDKGKMPLRAEAGWFGSKPVVKNGQTLTKSQNNARLRSVYGKFGLKVDGAGIKNELAGYKAGGASLKSRQAIAKLIRDKPPLLRAPRA